MARTSLRRRILFWFSIVFVGLLVLVGALVRNGLQDLLVDQLAQGLEEKARSLSVDLDPASLDPWVESQGEALDARVTIIDSDGVVLADSDSDPGVMDNHLSRPEVVQALSGEVGTSRRFSDTTEARRLYVALPPSDELIVRLSVTEAQIDDELRALSGRIVSTIALVGVAGLVAAAVVSDRVVRPISELTEIAASVADGRHDLVARRSSVGELDRLGLAVGRMGSELGQRIAAIEEERQTLESVLGALPQAVLLIEPDDEVSYANAAAESLVGPVPESLNGLAPTSIQRLVREARTRQEAHSVDLEHGSPPLLLRAVVTPFRDGDPRVLVVVVDNTERERVEAMRRDFVADASHELKTPVAAILASMETLEMALESGSERANDFAHQVTEAAKRLARIVEDLLDLSRLEVSTSPDEEVDLGALVTDEVKRLKRYAKEGGIDFSREVAAVRFVGSPADLSLAVRNLVDNAIRYTDPGGSVRVALQTDGAVVRLEVSDTGTGIPTRDLPRVFERFYRVDVARSRATGGTGLGLALVKHVAERHGGSVAVQSELGVGSTFTMTLPVRVEISEPTVPSKK